MSDEPKIGIGNVHPKPVIEITARTVAAIERQILDEAATFEVQFDNGGPGEVVSVSDAAHVAARYVASLRATAIRTEAEHPEARCHRCGGPNIVWNAPSPLWNAVMRGGSINGDDEHDGVVCPVCFAALAEERGVAGGRWRLFSERTLVELETVTPSGRVWDERTWLWSDALSVSVEPVPSTPRAETLAQRFHEAYEQLAPSFGYETREASAKPWADVPEQNRALMIAVCAELLAEEETNDAD